MPRELIVPRSQFYVAHDYPEDVRPGIEAIYNSPDFFENLEVMQGLHDGWQAMLDNGYLPRVASAPLESNRNAIEGKIKWLDRVMVPEFGVGVVEDAIIDKDKWKYRALAIIDDNPVMVLKVPNGNTFFSVGHTSLQFQWRQPPFGYLIGKIRIS